MFHFITEPQEQSFFDYDISPEQREIIDAGPGKLRVWGDFDLDWDKASPPGRRPKTPSGKDAAKAISYLSSLANTGAEVYKTWAAHHTNGVPQLIYHSWNTFTKVREVLVVYEPSKFARYVEAVNKPVAGARRALYLKLVGEGKKPISARIITAQKHPYAGE